MGQAERDNQMLMRIASILLLLAGAAMRASCASCPVRWRVFAILGQAEAIARLYALGAGVSALAPCIRVNGAIEPDLMSLALRFCRLALLLRIAAARSSRALPDRGMQSAHTDRVTAVEARAGRIPDRPDTS